MENNKYIYKTYQDSVVLDVRDLVINKDCLNKQYRLKYTKSQTWGYTVSIRDELTDKKICYAGGCGYCKTSAVLRSFFYQFMFKDSSEQSKNAIRDIADSGFFAGFSTLDEDKLKHFFNLLDLEITFFQNKKKDVFFKITESEQLKNYNRLNSVLSEKDTYNKISKL